MKYDIFISYKHTDENGEATRDLEIAKELYDGLTKCGYAVFFSANSLEEIGSSRYKSDIDDALDSVKLLIVVLTKAEYATSQWIKYEWDSFYNDYLSGNRKEANLFTLTGDGVSIHDLPRTLRNVQNFTYSGGIKAVCDYVRHALPIEKPIEKVEEGERRIEIITGRQVTEKDIEQAVELDGLVYDEIYHVTPSTCFEWFKVNPDIYIMARDTKSGRIIAYINISPVTEECYERIKKGDFIDTGISADMLMSYDFPFPYSVYFSSIVIHPDYQNTEVCMSMYNAVVKKFITMGEHEVYVKRMIADAVSAQGEKFCKMFGMKKLKSSDHNSNLYEVCMIPPKFRVFSKMTKTLYDYYVSKYEESPYLFTDEFEE